MIRPILALHFFFWVTTSVGADTTVLPAVSTQIDQVFEKWNESDSPGCATAVLSKGQTLYQHGYGNANLEHNVSIKPSTPFNVGSVSKQFTAASILLLVQQGKLSLDDDVRKYIPELPDFRRLITVRNLLHHTSGLRDQFQLLSMTGWRQNDDLSTEADVMNLLTRQRDLNFPPSSDFSYANTGYFLLAQIVKRISGSSLRDFTTNNLFKPLGMNNSHFRDDHAEIIKGEALSYIATKNGTFRTITPNSDIVGAGGLMTTVEDLAKWDENFYTGRVGGLDFTRNMTSIEALADGRYSNYALGLFLGKYRGLATVEHSGVDAGYRADLLRFPDQHFSVITLCNTVTNPIVLDREIADLYLANEFKEQARFPGKRITTPLPMEEIAAKVGFYRLRQGALVMKIDSQNGILQIVEDDERAALQTTGTGQYVLPNLTSPVRFEPATGRAQRLIVEPLIGAAEVWERLPEFTLKSSALQAVLGSYRSEELDTVYRFEERSGNLILKRKGYPDQALRPVIQDVFTGRFGPYTMGVLEFSRGTSQKISGMWLTTSRVRRLRFSRE